MKHFIFNGLCECQVHLQAKEYETLHFHERCACQIHLPSGPGFLWGKIIPQKIRMPHNNVTVATVMDEPGALSLFEWD